MSPAQLGSHFRGYARRRRSFARRRPSRAARARPADHRAPGQCLLPGAAGLAGVRAGSLWPAGHGAQSSRCAGAVHGHHGRALCAGARAVRPAGPSADDHSICRADAKHSRAGGALDVESTTRPLGLADVPQPGASAGSAGPSGLPTDMDYSAIPRFLGDATTLVPPAHAATPYAGYDPARDSWRLRARAGGQSLFPT